MTMVVLVVSFNNFKVLTIHQIAWHEYPYGIKMSHLRDTVLLTQGSKDSTSPSNPQEPFLMEQLPREMQCQFILKPSRLAATQQLSDSSQKTFKRRRSIINWAFWRGSSTHLDNLPMSPTSPLPGQLFGASLPNICENDNLPKPVLDMLFFLNQKGPLTKGIFRQSANVKSCRELKEKLNSGVEVHLDCESVFVIASVLKDFLRNIPGSIFSSALYDHWICIMDQGNDEEKINTIQRAHFSAFRLLDQLPRANVVLLRYLFGVLYNIEQHSSSNQMTAFNLAVCIAPSILWPPTSSSPELENEFTKKVSLLIQFLIENCCRIFGEEITSLLGEISVRCDNRENASDISCFQLNDSSYDSLENELHEDVDAPCSDLVKKLKKGYVSPSGDAILSQKDEDYMKQTQPLQEESKACFKRNLVTGTDISKKNATNQNVKKKSLSSNEGHRVKLFPKSKPVAISVAPYSGMSLQDHCRTQPINADTPGYSPPHTADALKSSRMHRRCSEPNIDDQHCKLTYFRGIYSKKQHKTSCETGPLHGEEDYLKRHKSLQMEGQKLINQSLVMGIEIGKSSATHQNTEKVLSPRLNICPSTSYSSLSSPGTSPSGSSVSSQDSAFSQISEHSMFTPTETSSPIDCTFQAPRKQEELSSDFSSSSLVSLMPSSSSGQASNYLAYPKKDTVEWHSQLHSVTLHPSTWLRNGVASLKNWSLKKKARASRPEEKKICSLKGPIEPPPYDSGFREANLLQERQKDISLRATEGLGAGQTSQWYSSYPCQDSEKQCSSSFSLMEDRLKFCKKSHKEVEDGGKHSPGPLPCERSSPSSLTVDDVSSPESGTAIVCDDGDRHLTKDI
nr:rho GTPase-activating protein 20 [Loxodonta africana]